MVLYSWYNNQQTQKIKNNKINHISNKNKHLANCSSWPTAKIILNNEPPPNIILMKNSDTFFMKQEINWQNLLFEK